MLILLAVSSEWTFCPIENRCSIVCFLREQALRCRTEDGPGEEELKKISRLCMKKVGENESNSEDDNSGSSENGNDNDYYGTANRNRNDGTNFNNRNQRNKMNDNRYNQNQYNGQNVNYPGDGRDNSFGSLQSPARDSNWPSANGNGNSYDWNGNQSYGSMGPRGQGRAGTRSNQTEQDRACFVHCFYHELKLVSPLSASFRSTHSRFTFFADEQ